MKLPNVFVQNKNCKYYPCHDINNEDIFNCKFCYCPLYYTSCAGNYTILSNGIKDCSNCKMPHDNTVLIIEQIRHKRSR